MTQGHICNLGCSCKVAQEHAVWVEGKSTQWFYWNLLSCKGRMCPQPLKEDGGLCVPGLSAS